MERGSRIMRLISPVLKRVVYPGLARSGYLRHYARDGTLCVVTYHGIRPPGYRSLDKIFDGGLVSASAFRDQLRLLKSRYCIVTPNEFREWMQHKAELPPRAVLVTCDDGLKNTLTDMVPVLREEGVSCLFFVTGASTENGKSMLWYEELYLMLTGALPRMFEMEELGVREMLADGPSRRVLWSRLVKRLSQYDWAQRRALMDQVRERCGLADDWSAVHWNDVARRQRLWLLNSNDLRELDSDGMTVGAHTLSHPALPEAPDEITWAEISGSRSRLEKVLGTNIWALAYPFGDVASVTEREIRMAQEAGFECAFINYGGGFGANLQKYAIPRVDVTADMSLGELEAHVSGLYRMLRQRLGHEDS